MKVDLTVPLRQLPDPLPVEPPARPFDAAIAPPGSKSITCRAFVLAALARGASRIAAPLRADDTDRLLEALRTLGAGVQRDGDAVVIRGVAGRFPRGGTVDLGDGGAPARFMIAAATLAAEPVVVDGSARMRQRPVAEGVDFLRQLGASIAYERHEGRLPVRVTPSPLAGGELAIPTTLSSQFVSALMLIAPFLPQGLSLSFRGEVTSEDYLGLTEHVLGQWTVPVERDGARPAALRIPPKAVAAREYAVEPDASSAAYWMIAAALRPGARVRLPGMRLPSAQPDARVAEALRFAGAGPEAGEAGVVVRGPDRLRWPAQLDARRMPDASVALAAAAAAGGSRVTLTGLRTLRFKESDRIGALAAELGRLGCAVETTDDSIAVDPARRHDRPAVIETYNDHRMAMAFAVLGLLRPGISIRDPACVAKSYPGFWSHLARLYDR